MSVTLWTKKAGECVPAQFANKTGSLSDVLQSKGYAPSLARKKINYEVSVIGHKTLRLSCLERW